MMEQDVFREVPLRYLGYANEVGEAFRYLVPVKLVHFSYLVSATYVVSHSLFRASLAKRKQQDLDRTQQQQPPPLPPSSTKVMIDTLIWQGLASVIIPGLVINRTCAVSRLFMYHMCKHNMSKAARKWTVTGIGLGSIPIIIHPIDRTVDKLMDIYIRPLLD